MISVIQRYAIGKAVCRNRNVRSITYLHSGARVRGLKREPSSYLKNPKGLPYQDIKESEYQDIVRRSLQFDQSGIVLSNDLILQCLTHKSFAHGSKPYNEKLSLLGSQFLKYQASIHSISQPKIPSPVSEEKLHHAVSGLNFTNLGTKLSKSLISKTFMAAFIRAKNLDSLVFWKMKDPLSDSNCNGETTVLSTVLTAFVGAILVMNGPIKANRFVSKCLLNSDEDHSLLKIADKHFQDFNSVTEK